VEISRLRGEIDAANVKIETLNKTIGERNETIASEKVEIDKLNERIADATTEIERIRKQLEERDDSITSVRSEMESLVVQNEAAGKEEQKLLDGVSGAIEKLWVEGYITAAHALASEVSAKFPEKSGFADSARQLQTLLDALAGDPTALPDVIPQ